MTQPFDNFASDGPAHRWREPSRSVAERRPPDKSNVSTRPILVTTADNRELLGESELEAKAAFVLMARPDCLRLYEQARICYVGANGRPTTHVFDFLMVLRSGVRIAVAVKPRQVAAKYNLAGLLHHIALQMDPAFATGVLLLTDAMMPPHLVANGRLVHDARRLPDPALDRAVRAAIASLNGATSIVTVRRLAGLAEHDQGFYAVARAIGDGLIRPVAPGPITPSTVVRAVVPRGQR